MWKDSQSKKLRVNVIELFLDPKLEKIRFLFFATYKMVKLFRDVCAI